MWTWQVGSNKKMLLVAILEMLCLLFWSILRTKSQDILASAALTRGQGQY